MRRLPTEPMLSLYSGHDRELLFHGDHAACVARGIRIAKDLTYVRFDGKKYKVVQKDFTYPPAGSAAFWLAY